MIDVEKIKQSLMKSRSWKRKPMQASDYLSTGSTLLNLACTGKMRGGFVKGHYFFIVGDSVSGKTFLSLTCLAEASINKHFDGYRFIFDNAEDGALMNIERFFGKGVADRLEPPATDKDGNSIYSVTIEDFYFHVDDAFKAKKPFIYVLDSMDSLTSLYEGRKFDERKSAARGGPAAKGDWGDGKPKINSAGIRRVLSKLGKTGSILIVISQTRDNLNAGPFEPSKTRSGGHALRFYATLELWSSVRSRLKKTVKGKQRQVGILSRVAVKKNRLTGQERIIDIPIYHSSGIDDLGGCVDYLVEEGYWSKARTLIKAKEFEIALSREALIAHIEDKGLENELRLLVAEVWGDIEEACKVKRKSRYTKEKAGCWC